MRGEALLRTGSTDRARTELTAARTLAEDAGDHATRSATDRLLDETGRLTVPVM